MVPNADGYPVLSDHGPISAALELNGEPLDEANLWTSIAKVQDETSFELVLWRNGQTMLLEAEIE